MSPTQSVAVSCDPVAGNKFDNSAVFGAGLLDVVVGECAEFWPVAFELGNPLVDDSARGNDDSMTVTVACSEPFGERDNGGRCFAGAGRHCTDETLPGRLVAGDGSVLVWVERTSSDSAGVCGGEQIGCCRVSNDVGCVVPAAVDACADVVDGERVVAVVVAPGEKPGNIGTSDTCDMLVPAEQFGDVAAVARLVDDDAVAAGVVGERDKVADFAVCVGPGELTKVAPQWRARWCGHTESNAPAGVAHGEIAAGCVGILGVGEPFDELGVVEEGEPLTSTCWFGASMVVGSSGDDECRVDVPEGCQGGVSGKFDSTVYEAGDEFDDSGVNDCLCFYRGCAPCGGACAVSDDTDRPKCSDGVGAGPQRRPDDGFGRESKLGHAGDVVVSSFPHIHRRTGVPGDCS